ncbi:FAD binding domain-containing protein [Penicillium angulare]|uniref:FAD binding domain-containing protein n=1 Tax=Penicillium angulare TaxID=116970 RepID=A0A9W9KCW0_9EURO|nr:FAD binding domain-containing protein [Penicillium angulare]
MADEPVIIIGGGLAGLVAAFELSKRQVRSVIIDQENETSLGGQAFWSLGGLFIVNTREQRVARIKDSRELALQDWLSTAKFDRECDYWPRKWAEAFIDFASTEFEQYVKSLGLTFFNVSWAERGDGSAGGHGNSVSSLLHPNLNAGTKSDWKNHQVPRFHASWGTGPAVVDIFEKPVREAAKKGLVEFKFRHQVDSILIDEHTGAAIGVKGQILEPSDTPRGVASSRKTVDTFEIRGSKVLISSGGVGANLEVVKKNWPVDRLGAVPSNLVIGVPAHVDGRMIDIAHDAGANVINSDRMWHYTEGLSNWNPIWPNHGIRIIPGPSSLWLDAAGHRLPPMLYPGTDTLGTLKHICHSGSDYTWFILNKTIVANEYVLSGSEQNPDVTGKSILQTLKRLFSWSPTEPIQAFMDKGADFVVENNLPDLVTGMNRLAKERGGPALEIEDIEHEIHLRDLQVDNAFTKDAQIMLIRNARNYWPDRMYRVVKLHKLLDPKHGPLIAIRLNILTRKTLGGLETNLDGNVLRPDGSVFPGLYAAGEASGFGGGGGSRVQCP